MESIEKIKKSSINVYFRLGIILVFIALIYYSTFVWLYERYVSADSYYSHGFLVPIVTVFLIWSKREKLKAMNWQKNYCGLALIISALIVHLSSILMEVFFISGFSILILVFGISLFLFGKKLTKEIKFPLFFLIFMFPLPLVAINAISFPMKMFATKSAVFVLQTFTNIPLKSAGFQIFFPQGSLIVGNPCSGLRSLISMLALGSIFAYFLNASLIKKSILFCLAALVALISNFIRVILLSLGVYIYGSRIVDGFFHDFTGYLVFIIAFGSLWLFWRTFQCRSLT